MSENSGVWLMGLRGEEGRLAQLERGPRAVYSRDSPSFLMLLEMLKLEECRTKQTVRPKSPDLSLNPGSWDGWWGWVSDPHVKNHEVRAEGNWWEGRGTESEKCCHLSWTSPGTRENWTYFKSSAREGSVRELHHCQSLHY